MKNINSGIETLLAAHRERSGTLAFSTANTTAADGPSAASTCHRSASAAAAFWVTAGTSSRPAAVLRARLDVWARRTSDRHRDQQCNRTNSQHRNALNQPAQDKQEQADVQKRTNDTLFFG